MYRASLFFWRMTCHSKIDATTVRRSVSGLPTIRRGTCIIPHNETSIWHSWLCFISRSCPGNVAGYVPWRISGWHVVVPLLGTSSFRLVGGLGTPAPIFPTRHLVVSGLYQCVRNPMYVAVVSLILGQGLFFGSVRVLEYGIAVRVGFHLFVLLYEEPILRKSYGFEYEDFCTNVPRWIPHLRPRRRNQERSRLAR